MLRESTRLSDPGTPPTAPRAVRPALLWAAAIVAGVLSPGALYLLSGYTLSWRDTSKLFQPIRPTVVEALRSFHLPLWNPHEILGIPLFAQMMHGVLHPVSLLGAYLFPHAGMDALILGYFALAALGAALFSRVLGAPLTAAAIAGFGYGLSGYVQGLSSNVQYLCAAATAPWVLAALRRAGEGRRFGASAAALACCALWFSGDPQWSIVALLLGFALSWEAGGGPGVRRAALGVAVGTALAAVQLIPTLVFLQETSRGVQLDPFDRLTWALAPWRLIEFLVPGFFGSPNLGTTQWPVFIWLGGMSRPGLEMPFLPSVYLGGGLLLLAVAGLRQKRLTLLLGGAALVLLWLALGFHAGSEQLLHHLPVWGKFRYAEKLVGPLALCLAVLASFGAQQLAGNPDRRWAVLAGGLGALALVGAVFFWRSPSFAAQVDTPAAQQGVLQAYHNLSRGLVHAGVSLVALAGLIAAGLRWPRLRPALPPLLAALVFLESSLAAPFALHAGNPGVCDSAPLAAIKVNGEQTRIATPMEENYYYPRGLDLLDAQVGGQSHMGSPSYNVASGIDQINTYTGLRPQRFDSLIGALNGSFGPRSLAALRRYSLTHMVVKNPHTPQETEIAIAASEGGTRVLDNPEWDFSVWRVPHRPWALFAGELLPASGEDAALQGLLAAYAKGAGAVVLEGATSVPRDPGAGRVLSAARTENTLRIDAEAGQDGVLVINDSFWPGWQARLDGREIPIWRADYVVRAVPWSSGRHLLEMEYYPREVMIGWLLTLAGAVAFINLAILEGRRKRN
ncbi:hypothetical protein GMST_30030 [Geomonas silvestris]|uniref:YfhO family protein n=1 Tax=Geomonas silvestris TaxID=2740184 RepID=A0A6V8ML10_9BACT|nr:hypothetical protein [Geomonas silvestris]GFO60678.1 hypothetical protein GMST_30030 [Geomonas silvestris]